jgi:hypothetical protein
MMKLWHGGTRAFITTYNLVIMSFSTESTGRRGTGIHRKRVDFRNSSSVREEKRKISLKTYPPQTQIYQLLVIDRLKTIF